MKLRHLSDERLTEMMIFPALQKKKDSEIYLWIRSKFMSALKRTRTCVAIGYSFRDADILDDIISCMNVNPDLWMILVSPHASQNKDIYFRPNLEISSRVLAINRSIENTIGGRIMDEYLDSLTETRGLEEHFWKEQATSSEPLRQKLENNVISRYRRVGSTDPILHQDRIDWINSIMSERAKAYDLPHTTREI